MVYWRWNVTTRCAAVVCRMSVRSPLSQLHWFGPNVETILSSFPGSHRSLNILQLHHNSSSSLNKAFRSISCNHSSNLFPCFSRCLLKKKSCYNIFEAFCDIFWSVCLFKKSEFTGVYLCMSHIFDVKMACMCLYNVVVFIFYSG